MVTPPRFGPATPYLKIMKKTLLLASLLATSASASVIHYAFTGEFTSTEVPASIAQGDHFKLTFDLNTSSVDTNPELRFGFFPDALSHLVFSLDPGSIGNYAGGTITTTTSVNLVDVDGFGWFASLSSPLWMPTGINFAPAGSDPFREISFDLYSLSGDTIGLTSPVGQTLDSALPVLNLSSFHGGGVNLMFGPVDDDLQTSARITSIVAAPTPDSPSYLTTSSAAAFVILMLAYVKRIRRFRVRLER